MQIAVRVDVDDERLAVAVDAQIDAPVVAALEGLEGGERHVDAASGDANAVIEVYPALAKPGPIGARAAHHVLEAVKALGARAGLVDGRLQRERRPAPEAAVDQLRKTFGGQLQPQPQTITRWYLSDLESAEHEADAGMLERQRSPSTTFTSVA